MGDYPYTPEEHTQIIRRLKAIGHLDRDYPEEYPHPSPDQQYREIPCAASGSPQRRAQTLLLDGDELR